MGFEPMEILAPAGDWDMLRAAVYSGADCVYIGVEGFNARRPAANFGGKDMAEAVAFCHARNCKVYAALNTVVLPGQETQLAKAVEQVVQAGCDALIVQDIGVAAFVKKHTALPLHGSTQMSVHSLEGVLQLADMGFSRVILARELERDEIFAIAAQSPIELEVFVHGALCVSVSGQCYMSAFLGGRSANRGACAGTCRLPFSARTGVNRLGEKAEKQLAAGEESHLSLKDLSVLDALPELARAGVVSAKIEGRLRGPEYAAVVVESARKALAGEPYDRQLLQDIFSRSGFTEGWYGGLMGREMFGVRTPADLAAAKKAQPKARELFRRERPRVPVTMELTLEATGARLQVCDGANTVSAEWSQPLEPAAREMAAGLKAALEKTGGTPFYLAQDGVKLETNGLFLPGSVAGDLRRKALEQLLEKRQQPVVNPGWSVPLEPALPIKTRMPLGRPALRARFEALAQVPEEALEICEEIVLPVFEAQAVPEEWRHKTRLWLPRTLFGKQEKQAIQAVENSSGLGFKGYEAGNLAHWHICRGLPVFSGLGLNLANGEAVLEAAKWSPDGLCLTPELSIRQMRQIEGLPQVASRIALDALCYGHLPLMITRACPLRHVTGCAGCPKQGSLADRKGKAFPVMCHGMVRTIHNPVPLWMLDRLEELPVQSATLYFTLETRRQAAGILRAARQGEAAPGEFTRGLYDKGVSE